MDIDFYKIVTGLNDLVLINYITAPPPNPDNLPGLSRELCNRRTGVGANGVAYLFPGEEKNLKLKFFRPDGEESVLYNDALLCMSRFIFDSGMTGSAMMVETIRGIRRVDLLDSRNFRLNMGAPLSYNLDPLLPDPDTDYSSNILIEDKSLSMVPLVLQKRGAVFLDGGEYRGRRKEISRKLNSMKGKKESAHPVFVTIHNRDEIGIDSPLDKLNADNASSCALGGMSGVLTGLSDKEAVIRSRHFRYYFQWDEKEKIVYLTGSADYAFSGSFYFEERNSSS